MTEHDRRHGCPITDPNDWRYHLVAFAALIPTERATVDESEAQFRANHPEIAAWRAYKTQKRAYDEELESLQREEEGAPSRHTTDDHVDCWPEPPNAPTCTEPSAEYEKTFDERIAQFQRDREHLDRCKKRAFGELVARIDPDLYAPGVKGGVAYDAFRGHLGKRGGK